MSQRESTMPLSFSAAEHDPFAVPARFEIASTPAQIEMWLSEKSDGSAGLAYNEAFSIRLDGDVHEKALTLALQTLTDFHEALRGHFSADGLQFIVESSVPMPIARHDLSALSGEQRLHELDCLVMQDSATPFNLETGPLVRATIIRIHASALVVILSAHHAVADGWSLDVLLADLGRLYSAFVGTAALPAPPQHGFSDFVRYCSTPENSARIQASRSFWQRKLSVVPPAPSLAYDGKRPPSRSYGAHHAALSMSAAELAQLKAFARAEDLSFFSVMISGYATLLYRLSGATDLVVGIPIAGHPDAGMEDCVGHLVNLVPIRFDFSNKPSFRELCRTTNTALLDARENAWVSFGEIVKDLKIARDPARVPLVPVIFTHVQKYAPGKLAFGSCAVDYELNPRVSETFEVNLNAIEAHDGLCFQAHANSDLYSQQWLTWRLQELVTLLLAGCASADTTVDALPLLSPAEAELVRDKLNETRADYPRTTPLAQLVEAQVARTPQAIAVVYGNESMTFAELNAAANQLAYELRARGVGPDRLVGIFVERSLDMVVGLLAIVKAGGAYLPLDPSLPPERLRMMLEDSGAAVLVTQESLRDTLPAHPETLVLVDDTSWRSHPRENLGVAVDPDHLGYVIYTSGSTGKPKGVEIPRGALTNLLWSMRDWLALGEKDCLLAVTTISFDIAGVDMWLPLLVGARLVIASRDEAVDGDALRRKLDQESITFLQATPVTWRLLFAAGWRGKADLQAVSTGEALPQDLAAALEPVVQRLWNLYGPTETTIWSTGYLVRDGKAPVLIGRPVSNTQCYVLDENRQPVPMGAVGELYIGGDGLARGYLGQPKLTAERFVTNSLSVQPGARMYRTGDLVRYQFDGNLVCLGRSDHQVKIRGYRIELGEIESALVTHDSVREAVVVAREEQAGDVRLVGYIKPSGTTIDERSLREHLKRSLPDYMIPQHYVVLQTFPTTSSGKIDRKALPNPELTPIAAPVARGPRTKTEQQLAELWKKLLQRGGIGIDDNFFDIGGHSLLGVALSVEIKNWLGIQLPLSQILRTPTLAGLASAMDAMARPAERTIAGDSECLIEIRPGGAKPFFFVYDGLGEILPYLNLARRMPPRYSVYGILPKRLPGIPMAHGSVVAMAEHCVAEMRRKQPSGPYLLGGLCAGGVIAFAAAEQLERQGQAVASVVLLDAVAPSATARRWRISSQRWSRFSGTLVQALQSPTEFERSGSAPSQESIVKRLAAAARALRKIKGVVSYEAFQFVQSMTVVARFHLLQRVLSEGRHWPGWMPSLTVPEIYENVRSHYNPGQVQAPLILVRAREGVDADAPAVELVVDPWLGWKELAATPLRVIDAVGGHSSMLQEPSVDSLAERLIELLEANASTSAAAPVKEAIRE
jgi:amino acid adenylation domain-containing protein